MTTVSLLSPSSTGFSVLAKRRVSPQRNAAINLPAKFLGQIEGVAWKSAIQTWRAETIKPVSIDFDFYGRKYRVAFD